MGKQRKQEVHSTLEIMGNFTILAREYDYNLMAFENKRKMKNY